MRNAIVTSTLLTHGTPTGVQVAACVAGDAFRTRTIDMLTGI
jgi:hypothetical protein